MILTMRLVQTATNDGGVAWHANKKGTTTVLRQWRKWCKWCKWHDALTLSSNEALCEGNRRSTEAATVAAKIQLLQALAKPFLATLALATLALQDCHHHHLSEAV
jgi:hypothetical protein